MKKENNDNFYKLSRTKIELFTNCARCFHLDVKYKIKRPSGPAFTLNNTVDYLLKKEFDIHRSKGNPHPLMKKYGIKAIPLEHENMDTWRKNFEGVQHYHDKSNILVFGAIDDIWVDDNNIFYIVDYKATSTDKEISLEDKYKQSFKRQMEIYQWLLRENSFKVSNTGYFVYCNGKKDRKAFDGKLEFDIEIIKYTGNSNWISKTLLDIRKNLDSSKIPSSSSECEFCAYIKNLNKFIKN